MNAVLALNSGKNERGELTRETANRVNGAMHFAIAQETDIVVMVGGDADSMCDYATEHFPDGPRAIAENGSKDTVEGAHYVKMDVLNPMGIRRVDVFTNDFHVPRTKWTFLKVLGDDFDTTVHGIETDYITAKKMQLVKRREQAQLAIVKLKLIGISPNDDMWREQRLARFRFRGGTSIIARLLMKFDNATNINRD